MMCGCDPILPLDTLLKPKLKYFADDYVPITLERLRMAYTSAGKNMLEARKRNRKDDDKRDEEANFEPGDVYYFDQQSKPSQSTRLTIKWKPYYRIVKQLSPVNNLGKHKVSNNKKRVHVRSSRPCME